MPIVDYSGPWYWVYLGPLTRSRRKALHSVTSSKAVNIKQFSAIFQILITLSYGLKS